ncbi:hypothetical protein [Streptomyces sp. NBC_01618]|uniref:hypothetical protein n=1 Tax=Streptomyces sp. NBC_01618 TaxID=2975900 RepID=UPI00386496C8|nr:hypothetical protein OH735_17930 [Streptomyces sp. NBC_01618]
MMEITERTLSEPCEGVLVEPEGGSAVGVLVLAGSSGRIDTDRCRVLARAGMTAHPQQSRDFIHRLSKDV